MSGTESGAGGPEVIGVRHGMFGIEGSGDTSGYGRLVQPVALPGSTPRPYGGYFDNVIDRLAEVLGVDPTDLHAAEPATPANGVGASTHETPANRTPEDAPSSGKKMSAAAGAPTGG